MDLLFLGSTADDREGAGDVRFTDPLLFGFAQWPAGPRRRIVRNMAVFLDATLDLEAFDLARGGAREIVLPDVKAENAFRAR